MTGRNKRYSFQIRTHVFRYMSEKANDKNRKDFNIMKKKLIAILSVSLAVAMLCAIPSYAYLARTMGYVDSYRTVGIIYGSDSLGYYANSYVNSAAKGNIAKNYARLWMRTTGTSPTPVSKTSTGANSNDLDTPAINVGSRLPISARSWHCIELKDGQKWGHIADGTEMDYMLEYVFPL